MTDKELFAEYLKKMGSFHDDRYFHMADDLLRGQSSYLRMKFKGSSIFNPTWIKTIEDCMYALDQITNNPREVTTEVGAVMPIELAKKVNYESVQHLASHTQYIKDIDENGEVIPAKILGMFAKEELHTYENRFIATFIRRLILFIDKRYEFIKESVNLDEKEIMYVKNKSIVDGQEVEVETKITVKRETQDDLTVTARDYIARIEKLKEYVGYYFNSPFMKEFKTEKDVRRPIILTNILRKNPLYRKCYETFLFIERFDSLGVAFKVDRNFYEFNEKERKDLSYILLSNLLFLEMEEEKRAYKKTTKEYKPKLLSSIDDESFIYGDLVKGPVSYVRSDESYLEYLRKKIPTDMPLHPNKSEKVYYKDKYDLKNEIKNDINEIEALLARIRRQIAKYEKLVEKLLEERKVEEAEEARVRLEELKAKEKSILDAKREQIIAAAREDLLTNKKEKKSKKKIEKVEEVKEETPVIEEPAPEPEPEPEPVVEEPVQEEIIEEPVAQEQPQEEPAPEEVVEEQPEEPVIEEQPQPVEKESEPVIKEELVQEAAEEEPQEETPVIEEQPVEEEPVVEEPQEETTEPESEPVVEEENTPAQEEQPESVLKTPVEESPVVEEPVQEEQPVEEKKPTKKAKKPAKRKKKAAKVAQNENNEPAPAPVQEEQKESAPVVEEAPKEEKKKESKPRKAKAKKEPKPAKKTEDKKAKAEPKKEKKAPAKKAAKPAKEEKPVAKKEPKPVKEKKAPVKKEPKPKKVAPKKPAPKKEKAKPEAIPGKFIVKTNDGYYVNQKRLSNIKSDAKIFNDFNMANDIKKKLGGKVVKL